MARVNIEEIVDYLDYDMRRALKNAVEEVIPNVKFNERELFRVFKRQVGRKCNTWEQVPNYFVENE